MRTSRSNRLILWLILILAVSLVILSAYPAPAGDGAGTPAPPGGGASTPALAGETGAPAPSPSPQPPTGKTSLEPLKAELETIAAEAPGTFAFAVQDLLTGDRIVVGGDQVFHPASTIKVPLVMYLYHLAQIGQINLDERMTYLPEDDEDGTGILHGQGPGGSYTLRELADYTIRYSDNVAKNMLTRRLGPDAVGAYAATLGAGDAWNLRQTRAGDALGYLAELYARRNEPLFALLINQMEHTAFAPRLGDGFPPDVPVAYKIGTQTQGQFHDVALVFLEGRPFAMAGFSRGVASEEEAIAVLGRAGRAALRYFKSLPASQAGGQPQAGVTSDDLRLTQVSLVPAGATAEEPGVVLARDAGGRAAAIPPDDGFRVSSPDPAIIGRSGSPVARGRPPAPAPGRLRASILLAVADPRARVTWSGDAQAAAAPSGGAVDRIRML